jgi:hypothetical protein
MFITAHKILRFSQLAVLCCFAGLFHIYPFLEQRLTAEGMVQCLTFHLAYGLTLAAAVAIAFTLPSWFRNGLALIKAMPIRSGLFVLNALAFVVIIFTLFTQWGVITCMLFGAVFFSVAPAPFRGAPAPGPRADHHAIDLQFLALLPCPGHG